ncbi:MAG: ABC transporter substrate-binding protein, partial [Anaerolineaceae bacterium]|nr:ABC transporter substrate-binding protein [Anaerolineaceae bacterium]
MKKYRWQLLILFLTGLVVGTLLILEKRGGIGQLGTPQPVAGGVYTEALIGSLSRLNPLLDTSNQVDRDVDRLIFSGLVKFDSRGMPEPDLAESVRPSQDGVIYNITLRDNLTWHDGEPLTTADIAFTVNLLQTGDGYLPSDLVAFWKEISVIVLDELNVQFVLPEAFAPFQDYLAFGMLPNHLLGGNTLNEIANSTFNLEPVGSGPYQFSELTVENDVITGLTLKAFTNNSKSGPFLEEINFRYYPDAQS